MNDTKQQPCLADYPFVIKERVRYSDTDAHGHVNNAMFVTYLEIGRVILVQDRSDRLLDENCQYVVAHLSLDFLHEILCPGYVEIGIRISKIGRSSLTMEQVIFQNGICAAKADTVVVQTSKATRKSQSFSEGLRARLQEMQPQHAKTA